MTKKQELAQKRNYFKYTLKGMFKPKSLFVMTETESYYYDQMQELHKRLLDDIDFNSQSLGLKILPKCWCGKVGKYIPEYINKDFYRSSNNSGVVCKKHIKDY